MYCWQIVIKRIVFIEVLACLFVIGSEAFAAPSCQSLIKKPSSSVPVDTAMSGKNCRDRKVRYSRNTETQATSVVLECSSCYDGYEIQNVITTSPETGCEGGYATCNRIGGGFSVACQAIDCPGSTNYTFDLLAKIDSERGTQLGTRCYKTFMGSLTALAVEKASCASGYENYSASFVLNGLGCAASLNTCAPTYSFNCPAECPFKGWVASDRTDVHKFSRCAYSGGSYQCETSCETGYYYTINGCELCPSNMICVIGSVPKCKAGYYGVTIPGTGKFACSECPSVKKEDGTSFRGLSKEGSVGITSCYLPVGDYRSEKGVYEIKSKCYYVQK